MKIARKLKIQPIKNGRMYLPRFEPTLFEYPSFLIFDTVGSGSNPIWGKYIFCEK